jgi:hypothetical protein
VIKHEWERGVGHGQGWGAGTGQWHGPAVLPKRSSLKRRWLRIGLLTTEHYVLRGNMGTPGGYGMWWAGRTTGVFQPNEFAGWAAVEWAIARRLELAGLKLVSLAMGWPPRARWKHPSRSRELEVLCEVTRSWRRKLKKNRRERINAEIFYDETTIHSSTEPEGIAPAIE